ncbi:MAG: 4Fe-4S binding protein [Candidatus Woesearchaeota archaeon]
MTNNIKDPSKSKKKLGWKEIEIGGIIKGPTSLNNKTGSWKSFKPIIKSDKCIGCMKCYNACPDNSIIKGKDENRKIPDYVQGFNYEYCKGCGICANICPVNAIEMLRADGDDDE